MSDLFVDITLPSAVLLASILGSAHCAGMCGGLALALGQCWKSSLFYHLGRLMGYSLAGALAGWLGRSALGSSLPPWVPVVVAVSMGAILILLGVKAWVGRAPHLSIPGPFGRWIAQLISARTPLASGAAGFLSFLLPCGWLHSFVLAAVATQNPLKGGLALAVFWMGTVPALAGAQVAARALLKPLAGKTQRIAAVLLVASGFYTIGARVVPVFKPQPPDSCPRHAVDPTREG